jgi:hypothetical protein
MGQVQKQIRLSTVSKNSVLGYTKNIIKKLFQMSMISSKFNNSGMIIVDIYLLTKQISLIYFLIFIENIKKDIQIFINPFIRRTLWHSPKLFLYC